jgi:hypothetical protein
VKFISDFRQRISYFYRRRGRTVSKEVIFYLVETFGEEEVKISGEHVGYEWLPYRQALERLTYKNAKETLRKAEKHLHAARSIAVAPALDSAARTANSSDPRPGSQSTSLATNRRENSLTHTEGDLDSGNDDTLRNEKG